VNFGGDDYADMLAQVYPQMKAADPEAKLLVGGLLLECDPRVPSACSGSLGALPTRFLNGILSHHGANDGKNYFDGVAFHAYDFYWGSLGTFGNDNWDTAWNTTGPLALSKISFINGVFSNYGASGIFLMNTENALICDACKSDPIFELTKAYYLSQAYAVGLTNGLHANIWFNIFGWRNSGLVDQGHLPRPAFNAFQVARNIIQDAQPLGPVTHSDITGGGNVAGYKFIRNQREIWILWSRDGGIHPVQLSPGAPDKIEDVFGNLQPVSAFPTITLEPIYLIWN
jgi:hypothetical protein